MPTNPADLAWDHMNGVLRLRVVDRDVVVPGPIAGFLLSETGHGLTDDPAADLLRLELDLRCYARFIDGRVADMVEEMSYGHDSVTLAGGDVGPGRGRHLRLALAYLASAFEMHARYQSSGLHVQAWILQVRQFVIDAAIPSGLLAEASAGWRRSSDRPPFVSAYPTVKDFVAEKPGRAEPQWWAYRGKLPGGVSYGSQWRRDGDDDDRQAAPLPRTGPWHVAYLPRTGEIYAYRRGGRGPEEVWLLGTDWCDRTEVDNLLTTLQKRIREPNSLLLVTQVLHALQVSTEEPLFDASDLPPAGR